MQDDFFKMSYFKANAYDQFKGQIWFEITFPRTGTLTSFNNQVFMSPTYYYINVKKELTV
jgi:hypothetical protein